MTELSLFNSLFNDLLGNTSSSLYTTANTPRVDIKEEDKDELAYKLAIAAIKYADLLPNRTSDYVFDPVKFSDINGNTGTYLLYSTVRMKSLLNKCEIEYKKYHKISSTYERNIIMNII